ncbi:MAG: HIT family protein [Anaerolineae bacterium]|nr:HIT family protein [Anaerolineae bacterium]
MARIWMPLAKWRGLIDGTTCPMCGDQTADENEYSFKIATLASGRLQLQKNQFIKGYCLLIANGHYSELHTMPADQQATFLRDMVTVGAALMDVFGADKMNYEILGNGIPHVHAHIKPRYYGEGSPRRIGNSAGVCHLAREDYQQRVEAIRSALRKLETNQDERPKFK